MMINLDSSSSHGQNTASTSKPSLLLSPTHSELFIQVASLSCQETTQTEEIYTTKFLIITAGFPELSGYTAWVPKMRIMKNTHVK